MKIFGIKCKNSNRNNYYNYAEEIIMDKKIKLLIILSSSALFVVGWLMFCGYNWSWGPFNKFANIKNGKLEGNKMEIVVEKQTTELTDKTILYLGSSVTYGASSLQKSFVEYISERNDSKYIKEAVSGTTLADNGPKSYVSRLKRVNTNAKVDLFVCQLSTNDASRNKTLGEIKDGNYDVKTTCGAIQYIVSYVKEKFNCPVVFYTGSYYESDRYSKMVDILLELSNKMGFYVADLYTDEEFNNISKEDYKLYMADQVHPTRAGYYYWWTPKIEAKMIEAIKSK